MGCVSSKERERNEGGASRKPNGTATSPNTVNHIEDTSDEHFSHQQKQILRETWQVLAEDKQKHGIAIFQRIFSIEPVTKQLFPFRELSGEQLVSNSLFRSHAMRFMNAVECTIVNLDALDLALIPVLHRLGQRHAHLRGFRQDYFSAFMSSIQGVVAEELGERCTEQTRDAWEHLGNFVAARMMEGYMKVADMSDAALLIHSASLNSAQKRHPQQNVSEESDEQQNDVQTNDQVQNDAMKRDGQQNNSQKTDEQLTSATRCEEQQIVDKMQNNEQQNSVTKSDAQQHDAQEKISQESLEYVMTQEGDKPEGGDIALTETSHNEVLIHVDVTG